jgi:8-oxo-dGTP pyrophosphatase MutT (NUDIX family)
MQVVYTGDEMPESFTSSIFLAGPTPRNKEEVESWRPDALKLLEDMGYDGVVFVPEDKEKVFKKDYDDQIEWEEKYLNIADCIVFWVPRDLTLDSKDFPKMAAFTTNVEWGHWYDSGKVVFGYPEGAEKVSYLEHYADKCNVPIGKTLTETLDHAMEMVGNGAERESGERYVPLFIWKTESFQSWYGAQKRAGNRLENARLLFNFRPRYKDFVFLWVLKANVWVESEGRYKDNEVVLARTDISSVLLWHKTLPLEFSKVIIVKEFRSPANTEDGFVRELPGGSSPGKNTDHEETAAEEIQEETGLYVDPSRIRFHEARQLAATFSSHKAYLYSVELKDDELEWFKSQEGIVHGNTKDTERTFIEIYTVKQLLQSNLVDWSTLGMIWSAYYRAWNEDLYA